MKKAIKQKFLVVSLKTIIAEMTNKSNIYKNEARYGLFNMSNEAILVLSEMVTNNGT